MCRNTRCLLPEFRKPKIFLIVRSLEIYAGRKVMKYRTPCFIGHHVFLP